MSDNLDLEAIEARANAATTGPWHGEHDQTGCVSIGDYGWVCSGPSFPAYDVDSEQGKADAEFIAHARTDVPQLIAEVRQLREDDALACAVLSQRDTEIRLLREQRQQVLAACDKSEAGCTGRCADARLPFCVCERELPDAIRAIYASSTQPSNLEAQK